MARRRKRSKKWVSRLLFLVLLIAAIVVCYFVWEGYFKEDKVKPEKEEKKEETSFVEKTKDTEQKQEEQLASEVKKEEVPQYDGNNPNQEGELTGVVTYAGVLDDYLIVRVNIDQYLSSGKCELGLVRSGETIFKDEAGIVNSVSTATCEGFNVPVSKISAGRLDIIVKIFSGDKTGTIKGVVEI